MTAIIRRDYPGVVSQYYLAVLYLPVFGQQVRVRPSRHVLVIDMVFGTVQ